MRCIYCGCSEWDPCPEGCGWLQTNPPVCDAPACESKHAQAMVRKKPAKKGRRS